MAYVGIDWTPTTGADVELYQLSYAQILRPSETVVSATWDIVVLNGTDVDPLSRMVGVPSINGSTVSQMVGPLLEGVTYEMTCKAVTSLAQTLALTSRVECAAPL